MRRNNNPTPPALDVRRVVAAFAEHEVDCLLIGGVAGRLYGAGRPTLDIDFVTSHDRPNLDRVAAALRGLNAFARVGGLSDDEAQAMPIPVDGDMLSRMEVSTWRTDAGDIDILRVLRGADGSRLEYHDLVVRARRTTLRGVEVKLAGLDDIIGSKQFANRAKDREALPELIALQRRRQLDEAPE